MSLNQIGLIVDILGFVLLLRFGMPSKMIVYTGKILITEFTNEEEAKINAHNAKIKLWAKS